MANNGKEKQTVRGTKTHLVLLELETNSSGYWWGGREGIGQYGVGEGKVSNYCRQMDSKIYCKAIWEIWFQYL